ncbi:acyltransferase family protein [Desulfosporosinus sp. Sb-LF]|uniref:acyltransferase family protein n=1 Tax=Desulfosporosinus sp. Sb-LF TaxID=2560027 RepID=UPI00107EFC9B|nr:acyltransferase family protein [Desulfosporosinus sp. Sb-LF]TGE31898.1 hypothetical protein E4K68_14495 [Desulfosporosinus sp. Sb-LF]
MKTTSLRSRIPWVDTLKGLCMIFVIISHAYPPTVWIRLYTPFFLSGFFFASGYTFNMRDSFKNFFLQKVRTILVPLVFLSLINGVVGVLFKNIPFYVRLLGILIQQADGYESLWFFACLFVCELMFYVIVRYSTNEKVVLLISHLIGIVGFVYIAWGGVHLPWQFEIACVSSVFVSWGFVYRLHEEKIKNILNHPIVLAGMIIIYLVLCLMYDNDVNIHEERFGFQWLFVLEALIATAIVLLISQLLGKKKFLGFVGTHSIIYFSFQGFLLQSLRSVLGHLGVINTVVLCVIPVIVAISILSITALIIYKYLPFMVGKPIRKVRSKDQ